VKVVHITPTYFGDSSVIGGGERYVSELSAWMARHVPTTLVSFSSKRESYRRGDLQIELYPVRHFARGNRLNPLSLRYLLSMISADVVHVHQIHTIVGDLSCLTGKTFRHRVFVTDYGGGTSLTLNRWLPILRCYDRAITYSAFGIRCLPPVLQSRAVLIKGGIDLERFRYNDAAERSSTILFVGRLLPHKGVNYLIDGFRLLNRPDCRLRIVGRVSHQGFYAYLQELAAGLPVDFVHDADDGRLLREYQTARVTVLPSVHRTYDGSYTALPELMGFTLLESQACGTPVICTDAGAMHEFVDDGSTGFVVAQNSAQALADAIAGLLDRSASQQRDTAEKCRRWVESLGWPRVVEEHLRLYRSERE
jgi:glycosyltransferase involved in cell wall biosynthesis